MGIIEDTIFTVYKDALTRGDMNQAEHAVDLVKQLRSKIDIHGFLDPTDEAFQRTNIMGTFFEPFPYRYLEEESVVVFNNSAILLTSSENKLFKLLSSCETNGTDIQLITHDMIKNHMWEKPVTSNALRIAIKRIRSKIEPQENNPRILINYYNQGYLFLGKQLNG